MKQRRLSRKRSVSSYCSSIRVMRRSEPGSKKTLFQGSKRSCVEIWTQYLPNMDTYSTTIFDANNFFALVIVFNNDRFWSERLVYIFSTLLSLYRDNFRVICYNTTFFLWIVNLEYEQIRLYCEWNSDINIVLIQRDT